MQKTAYEMLISYWSADVCASDLRRPRQSSCSTNRFYGFKPQIIKFLVYSFIAVAPQHLSVAARLLETRNFQLETVAKQPPHPFKALEYPFPVRGVFHLSGQILSCPMFIVLPCTP